MKKTSKLMPILLLILLASFSFVTILPVSQTGAATPKVIKIGVVTDLTTAYSYYGGMEVAGLALGLAYAVGVTDVTTAIASTSYGFTVTGGGYIFQLYVADGQSSPTVSATAATNLILTDGVQILQGSPDSDSAIAVAAVAAANHIIFMAGPAADYDITASHFNVYTFRMASSSYQDALTGGAYAVNNIVPSDNKTFALIAPQDSWGSAEVSEWSDAITAAGGTILSAQYAPTTTTDFTPYINNAMTSGAACLIPAWAGAGAVQLFTGLKSLGAYNAMKVFTGVSDLATWNFVLAPLLPYSGLGFVGMMKYAYNLPSNAVNTWLINHYVTLFQADKLPEQTALTFPLPDLFIPDSFAVGQAIVKALTITGGNTVAAYMIQALEGMTLNTPKGPETIRKADHQALQVMYIVQVVYDPPSTFSPWYTTSSQFPAGSYWGALFLTYGIEGVFLLQTMTAAQTAPPIYAGAASAPRPPVTTVPKPIKISVTAPGLPATVLLSGCSVSPNVITANGITTYVRAKPGCTITATLPSNVNTKYLNLLGKSSLLITTCLSGVCPVYSATIHQQYHVTFTHTPSLYGTTVPTGSKWYNAGYKVGITATPGFGHSFKKWSSSTALIIIASPTSKITTAKIGGAGTVTAIFV